VLGSRDLHDAPLLLLANKQDLPQALNAGEVANALGIGRLDTRPVKVQLLLLLLFSKQDLPQAISASEQCRGGGWAPAHPALLYRSLQGTCLRGASVLLFAVCDTAVHPTTSVFRRAPCIHAQVHLLLRPTYGPSEG
jgi:hypothetical protein